MHVGEERVKFPSVAPIGFLTRVRFRSRHGLKTRVTRNVLLLRGDGEVLRGVESDIENYRAVACAYFYCAS